MAANIFVYYWLAGLGAVHLTIIAEDRGGGAFANKNYSQGQAFDQFFQMPGVYQGGMLTARTDSHIRDEPLKK